MALILSLETSTGVCSVALHDSLELLSYAETQQPQSHASQLAILIQQVLKESKRDAKSISAIAVSSGPGSYTGLRIGTSTAKGFCFSLNIPLISVTSLDILAHQVLEKKGAENDLLCPMIDAKRMEVYCQIVNRRGEVVQPIEARVIGTNSFDELLRNHKLFFFGDGAEKCKSVIQDPGAVFLANVYPKASTLGLIAAKKFEEGKFEDLVNFVPFYLKEFIAKKAPPVF